jgi:PAS domain S-box-containing protein
VNKATEEVTGCSRDELIGTDFAHYFTDPSRARMGYQQVFRNGSVKNYELAIRHKSGQETPVMYNASIYRDGAGKVIGIFAAARDITDRKRSEEALKRWGQVFEHAEWGIVVSSGDLKSLEFMNPAFAEMHGYTVEELSGRPISDVFAPEERAELQAQIDIANERGHYIWESKHIRKDGTIFPVLIDATAVKDEDGKVLYRAVNVQDITKRKQTEAVLKQALADLIRSNADLEQFAYVASHDLQEPLRNVASCMHMLEKGYKNKLGPEADQYIHYAVESAMRMKGLIQDLLTYSRIGTKGKGLAPTNCEHALDEALKNLRSAISGAGAEITHDALPTILADDAQMVQVFQNLIGNAIKFRRDQPCRVHVSAAKNQSEWTFSVKDNGIGIESQHLERIFVIFQRLNKRTEYEGTGMGLAIVKKIVERHQGRIWVESEPGVGTTFCFTIPVEESNL